MFQARWIVATALGVSAAALCSDASAQTLQAIDTTNSVGAYNDITVHSNNVAISYYDDTTDDLKLWYDDGNGGGTAGDRIANGSEIRTIDSTGSVGQFTSITTAGGYLAVSYYDVTNTALKLWWDDGNSGGIADDGIANGSEIRTVVSADDVGRYSDITELGGYIAVAFYDVTSGDLKLWWDDGKSSGTADDGIANGGEVRSIETIGYWLDVGRLSITTYNSRLAIAYFLSSSHDLKLWLDDGSGAGVAGDGVVNGTEARVIESANSVGLYPSVTVVDSKLAITYRDRTATDLNVWYDDGNGGGTASDGIANGSEIRTADTGGSGNRGEWTNATAANNHLVAVYADYTNADGLLWYDDGTSSGTADDFITNGGEVTNLQAAAGIASHMAVTYHNGMILASYYEILNSSGGGSADLYLATINLNAAPNAPSSLGPTAHTNGSSITEKSPQVTFTLSDSDSGDTVKYQIQIDDSSDFSSAVVDYTSVLAAQGATSFTVGQAAGSGSYTTGSSGQELAAGTYYWRVKAIDNSAAESSWTTANSGSAAFTVIERTVDFSASTYSGAEDGGAITVTVTLNGASDEQITVNYASSNGTATAGTDYTAASGTLTFSPSDTSETFAVTPTSDSSVESDETVTLTLSSPHDATLAGANNPATLTITNDDTAGVTITHISPKTVAEGSAHSYSVVLDSQPTNDVTISVITDSNTTASPQSLTFTSANWNTAQTALINATDDSVPKAASYSASASLSASSSDSNYNSIAINGIELLINDNDGSSSGGGDSNGGGGDADDAGSDAPDEVTEEQVDGGETPDDSAETEGDGATDDEDDGGLIEQPPEEIIERGELEEIEGLTIDVGSQEEVEIEIETGDGASASVMIGENNSIGGGTVSVTLFEEILDASGSEPAPKKVSLTLKVEAPAPPEESLDQDQNNDGMIIEMVVSQGDLDDVGLERASAGLVRWDGARWTNTGKNLGNQRPTKQVGQQGYFVGRDGLLHMWANVSLRDLFVAQLNRINQSSDDTVVTEYSIAQLNEDNEGDSSPNEQEELDDGQSTEDEQQELDDDQSSEDEQQQIDDTGDDQQEDNAADSNLCGVGSLGAGAGLYAMLTLAGCLRLRRRRFYY